MSWTLPAKLGGTLTDSEAAADALYRVILAFDTANETLLLSAVTEDVSVEMAGHLLSTHGVDEFKAAVFDRVSKLGTTHFLSNVRVSLETATTAKVSCSARAQHVRPGTGSEPGASKYTSGALYLVDLVKEGDLWKLKSWKANIVWVDGDKSVMAGVTVVRSWRAVPKGLLAAEKYKRGC